jgi:hypothetical protein
MNRAHYVKQRRKRIDHFRMEWGQDRTGWVLRWWEGKTDKRGLSEDAVRQDTFAES